MGIGRLNLMQKLELYLQDRLQAMRSALAEQTPPVMLLLALIFGIIAGLVAFVYSK